MVTKNNNILIVLGDNNIVFQDNKLGDIEINQGDSDGLNKLLSNYKKEVNNKQTTRQRKKDIQEIFDEFKEKNNEIFSVLNFNNEQSKKILSNIDKELRDSKKRDHTIILIVSIILLFLAIIFIGIPFLKITEYYLCRYECETYYNTKCEKDTKNTKCCTIALGKIYQRLLSEDNSLESLTDFLKTKLYFDTTNKYYKLIIDSIWGQISLIDSLKRYEYFYEEIIIKDTLNQYYDRVYDSIRNKKCALIKNSKVDLDSLKVFFNIYCNENSLKCGCKDSVNCCNEIKELIIELEFNEAYSVSMYNEFLDKYCIGNDTCSYCEYAKKEMNTLKVIIIGCWKSNDIEWEFKVDDSLTKKEYRIEYNCSYMINNDTLFVEDCIPNGRFNIQLIKNDYNKIKIDGYEYVRD